MKTVSVIGCGPSALACGAATSPGTRIGVNDACVYIDCELAVTMDGRWLANRWTHFLRDSSPDLYYRVGCAQKFGSDEWLWKIAGKSTPFVNDRKALLFGPTKDMLNGENSGYCALNLAWALKPERVFLYGFDMNYVKGRDHFFGNYEWKGQGCKNSPDKFQRWAKEMDHAAQQFKAAGIEVFNTNANSAIKAFQYGTP